MTTVNDPPRFTVEQNLRATLAQITALQAEPFTQLHIRALLIVLHAAVAQAELLALTTPPPPSAPP